MHLGVAAVAVEAVPLALMLMTARVATIGLFPLEEELHPHSPDPQQLSESGWELLQLELEDVLAMEENPLLLLVASATFLPLFTACLFGDVAVGVGAVDVADVVPFDAFELLSPLLVFGADNAIRSGSRPLCRTEK